MATAEDAIRRYLRHLRDPEASEEVRALHERVEGTDDPVERLQLRAALEAARGGRGVEEDFVGQVAAWAQREGITAAAFLEEGVPRSVLVRAGLLPARPGARRRHRPPRRRVSAAEVWAAIPEGEPFTLRELQEATGASAATVRKVVTEEAEAGNIAVEGQVGEQRRGRAPVAYRWVGEGE